MGTVINNEAGIYFDDNPVVMTNLTIENYGCLFSAKVSTVSSGIDIYPNPFHNKLEIKAESQIQTIVVSDIFGRNLISSSPNSPHAEINTTSLVPGIYIVKVDGTVAGKFVKE